MEKSKSKKKPVKRNYNRVSIDELRKRAKKGENWSISIKFSPEATLAILDEYEKNPSTYNRVVNVSVMKGLKKSK
jgi:hypothetical protein